MVVEICHRLDGLPLAIELAAPWIRVFPPPALLKRLARRLPLLIGGARDAPARHRTLRASLDWEYALLLPQERKLFARLSVFVGGCSLEAIAAVCAWEDDATADVLMGVTSLVKKSLLHQKTGVGDEPRFSMLETVTMEQAVASALDEPPDSSLTAA